MFSLFRAAFMAVLLTLTAILPARATMTAYDFTFDSIDGGALPLEQYRGKVLLVVNTASQCGFTRQYGGLQDLWTAYKDRGLVVLGVPSNDFGGQEPGTEAQIKEFCEVNFGIDFPMTEKESVSGNGAHPFYVWARDELGAGAAPRWNFHKYLVDTTGALVGGFASGVEPDSAELRGAIEPLLP